MGTLSCKVSVLDRDDLRDLGAMGALWSKEDRFDLTQLSPTLRFRKPLVALIARY